MSDLTIATRGSALAIAQSRAVARLLEAVEPGLTVRLRAVTTTGDRDRTSSVAALTEVGAFVRAVQREVLEGRADLAVHSCKDLPVAGPEGLVLRHPERETAWDVLCGETLDGLPEGARVGTGSPRRTAQLRLRRPDLDIAEIRGNVDSRLTKVAEGRYRAVVLAEAGLRRLGREEAVACRFTLEEMVPAPGQGALAVEARAGSRAAELARRIEHEETRRSVETERLLLEMTGAGCRAALGALACDRAGRLTATAFVADERGARRGVAEGDDPKGVAAALRRELGL